MLLQPENLTHLFLSEAYEHPSQITYARKKNTAYLHLKNMHQQRIQQYLEYIRVCACIYVYIIKNVCSLCPLLLNIYTLLLGWDWASNLNYNRREPWEYTELYCKKICKILDSKALVFSQCLQTKHVEKDLMLNNYILGAEVISGQPCKDRIRNLFDTPD